jgi:hypothetical protein
MAALQMTGQRRFTAPTKHSMHLDSDLPRANCDVACFSI